MRYLVIPWLTFVGCGHSQPHPGHSGHDHHAGHRFEDADAWASHFEDPSRNEWQKPDEVIDALELTPDLVVADIGAATGYFAVRLATAVPAGRVFGVDIEPDMIRYLGERAKREGLTNLTAVLGAPDDPRLPEPVDVILLVDTVHHIEGRVGYFERLRSSLRPDGRVVIIDFRMGDLPVGPPAEMKLAPEQLEAELASAGFVVSGHLDFLPYQYILVFTAK